MNYSNYYNGSWHKSHETFDVLNPSNGTRLATMSIVTPEEMKEVIKGAHDAFKEWSNKTAYYRCELLEKLYDLVMENKEELARTMTLENGKPYQESLGEITYGANFLKWYSEEGKRVYGEIIPPSVENKRIFASKQPIGLVYGITPWNFPFAMITRKLAPALASGCTFIIKPAEDTPLTCVKFFELLDQVGFPKGVANMVSGNPKDLTEVVMKDSRVRKITFTGSTEVGKSLMADASLTMKNISLELGGHAPLIVFNDADLDKAVSGTMNSKFRNCGQVCIACNRVLVHKDIKEKYLEKLLIAVNALKIGHGFEENVKIGPIINEKGFKKIKSHLEDALQKGARLVSGGEGYKNENGYYYKPTIIDHVTKEMRIFYEETFGPVIPLITFESTEEAIELANDTKYGLAAYFFTESISKATVVSEKLEYGMVGLNTGAISSTQAPFGGFKESGIGREGGHFGIEEYLETKYICLEI